LWANYFNTPVSLFGGDALPAASFTPEQTLASRGWGDVDVNRFLASTSPATAAAAGEYKLTPEQQAEVDAE